MLKPFGLSVAVSDATLARVTIVESLIPVSAGRANVNLFALLIQEISGKANALSGRSEGGRYAAKISRFRPR